MKVLAMIDSFKGTITSKRLGEITQEILKQNNIECDYYATSDGGDGFLDSLLINSNLKNKKVIVRDPLFREIESEYLVSENVAYIEMARHSGLNLLTKEELNPYQASSIGLGDAIKDAIDNGYKHIVIGIGGSATNDAGAGMLEALGVKYYSHNGLIHNIKNEDFTKIIRIKKDEFLENIKGIKFTVLSDVQNPLLGEKGATYTFSIQKGAKESDLEILENNIEAFSSFSDSTINNHGSGAAGGVGYALHEYFKADFYPGIDYLLKEIDFKKIIDNYDLIITGEGKIDKQSLLGKVVFKVASSAVNKNVILVCAINEVKEIENSNIKKIYSIVGEDVSINESLNNPEYYYKKLVEKIASDIKRGLYEKSNSIGHR